MKSLTQQRSDPQFALPHSTITLGEDGATEKLLPRKAPSLLVSPWPYDFFVVVAGFYSPRCFVLFFSPLFCLPGWLLAHLVDSATLPIS